MFYTYVNKKYKAIKAPTFSLNNQGGIQKNLSDYLREGSVVLTFYRGVWCPYCNLQLKEYNNHLAQIKDAGAVLVAITPERPGARDILLNSGASKNVTDMALGDVKFDVLHDVENRVAKAFGLVFELPGSHRQLLEMLNVDLEKLNGDTSYTFPDPATYVIDRSGQITWAFVPNNYRKRAEVDHILNALQDTNHKP